MCIRDSIGHGAIIHGAQIGENVLVGMNAVIMDDVMIGKNSIIGALTFVRAKTEIPSNSLVVGNPGKVIKKVSKEMVAWKSKGTKLYQTLPADLQAESNPVEPLREIPSDRPTQESLYKAWENISKRK